MSEHKNSTKQMREWTVGVSELRGNYNLINIISVTRYVVNAP